MSNRNADKATLILGKRIWEIEGSFVCPVAGANPIVPATVKGLGFGYAFQGRAMALKPTGQGQSGITSTPGILRTGAGVFTVTLEDPYIECITALAWLSGPAGVNDAVVTTQANLNTVQVAPTFTIATYNGTTGTPADLGVTYTVNFRFKFRDSTANYGTP